MAETLAALFFAHVLADYVFQTGWMIRHKRNPGVLVLHAGLVALTAMAATGQIYAPEILVLSLAHLAIDAAKTYLARDTVVAHLADQAAHLVTLGFVALAAPDLWATGHWVSTFGAPVHVLHVMLLCAGAIYAIRAGGFVVGDLMAPYAAVFAPEGLPDGGRVIGLLERGLIYVLLISGQTGSIGFLIAAKSVMRFETASREQKAAEYVIIGTLASFGWAITVTIAVLALRDALPAMGPVSS